MFGHKDIDINLRLRLSFLLRLRLSLSLSLFFLFMQTAQSQIIHEYMDLQIHPTMHIAHSHFGPGLTYFDESDPPNLTYKHRFKNVNYANYWENNKGCRIFVIGFLTKERIRKPKKARTMILEQMQYVEDFVQQHSDKFAIAKSPADVRNLVAQTKKTIIVYSIEGGKALVGSEEDAQFWASKGVAFITLIHLLDSELGSSSGISFSKSIENGRVLVSELPSGYYMLVLHDREKGLDYIRSVVIDDRQ